MKKICLMILGLFCLTLCGCKTKDVSVKAVCDYYTNLASYESDATMNMYRNDEVVTFKVGASYLSPSYYKIVFTSQSNNNEQIIVRNDNGVFVLTPTLNKQFKFDSDWPLNSSHAYLLSAIIKDITNDAEATMSTEEESIIISSKISHKVNQNLSYMKFYCSTKDYAPIRCNFYNGSDEKQVEVTFNSFNTSPNLTADSFDADKIMDQKTSILGEGAVESVSGTLSVSYLAEEEDDVQVISYQDRTIATYSGEKSYVVVSQTVTILEEATPTRIYSDLFLSTLGVVSTASNSITFFHKNQQITIYSNSLTTSELLEAAYSVTFA